MVAVLKKKPALWRFEKQYTRLPDCSRIKIPYADMGADDIIRNLPEIEKNTGREERRRKWELVGLGGTDVDWPEMLSWLEKFPCRKMVRAHVSLIPRNYSLPVHRDGVGIEGEKRMGFDFFNTTLRFHVVLKTTPDAYILSNRKFYHMAKDECWLLNNFEAHSAVNRSPDTDRYHVIFDVEPNQKTMKLVFGGDHELGIVNDDWLGELDWRQARNRPENKGALLRGPDFFFMGDFSQGGREMFQRICQHPKIIKAPKANKNFLGSEVNVEDYKALFPVKDLDELSGHLMPNLFERHKKITQVKSAFPKARFIVILPDASRRAELKVWKEHFPASQFHTVFLKKAKRKSAETIKDIFGFLNLESN